MTISGNSKDLSLREKISLLDKIEKPPNITQHHLSGVLGVPKTTIVRLIKQDDELRSAQTAGEGTSRALKKRRRTGKDPSVEEALNKWFSIVVHWGMSISGRILKRKVKEFGEKLGHTEFKATDGWWSHWKVWHGIKFKKAYGEKGSADMESAKLWKATKLPELLDKFSSDNIYNANETGLFHWATPDGSLVYKQESLLGFKKVMWEHVGFW